MMNTDCTHAELVAALPALRPGRDVGRVVEWVVIGVLFVAVGISFVSAAMGGYGIGFGAFLSGPMVLTPAWIHLRLWPRMVLLTRDVAGREELHLAGLTTPQHLWAAMRHPVRRALLIPMVLWAAGMVFVFMAMALTRDPVVIFFFRGQFTQLMIPLLPVLLGMAGAADVFGRLCRGMPRGQAVALSIAWIALALILLRFAVSHYHILRYASWALLPVAGLAVFGVAWSVQRLRALFPVNIAEGWDDPEERKSRQVQMTMATGCGIAATLPPLAMILGHALPVLLEPIVILLPACILMLSRVSFAIRAYCHGDAA